MRERDLRAPSADRRFSTLLLLIYVERSDGSGDVLFIQRLIFLKTRF